MSLNFEIIMMPQLRERNWWILFLLFQLCKCWDALVVLWSWVQF